MKNKTDYRVYAKELRKKINIKSISAALTEKVRQAEIYQNAKNVMLFYPTKYEIDLRDLLRDDKNFYLPKVNDNELLVCPYTENLEISKFNIYEPCSDPVDLKVLDLIIVPALMADKHGYRLGYGGGFYDRFLPQTDAKTLTVLPVELIVEELPRDDFDINIDHVITI